ncbi:MAG: thiamine phosphate synthase [bacterium]|nr:thiamine phosphate synthase [bacterium]
MFPLYLIVDRETCGNRDLVEVLSEALDAGVRFVQLREKALDRDALLQLAEQVVNLTDVYDACLTVNSHPKVAVAVGAKGVHLPAAGPSPESVREIGGEDLLVGCSTHDLSELDRAAASGADFVTFSPIYTPSLKPGYEGIGLERLLEAVGKTRLPVFALGGITSDRTGACRAVGCAGVAVMSGILAARDVRATVRDYLHAWEEG